MQPWKALIGGTSINLFATLDDGVLGALSASMYASVEIEPGPHVAGGTVRINRPADEISFIAEAGKLYYFSIEIGKFSKTEVNVLSETEGQRLVERYKMIESL